VFGVEAFLAGHASRRRRLIVVDLPPEEDAELCLRPAAGLNFIRLAAPTTDDKRLPKCSKTPAVSSIMCRLRGSPARRSRLFRRRRGGGADQAAYRPAHCVGFGVKNADNAEAIAKTADASSSARLWSPPSRIRWRR